MIRLNAGFSRKVGEPDYGSRGASVNVELEVESNLIGNPNALTQRIQELFALAKESVNAELDIHPSPTNGRGNGRATDRRATNSQVRAINAICKRQSLNPANVAGDRFGVATVEDLTLQQASSLIDDLNSSSSAGYGNNGNGRHR